MDTVIVTFQLPADLVQQAEKAGLLKEDMLTQWLQQELERRTRVAGFFETIDGLTALEQKPSPEEIEAEIQAYRDELP